MLIIYYIYVFIYKLSTAEHSFVNLSRWFQWGFGLSSPQRDVMQCIVGERRIIAKKYLLFRIILRFVTPNNIKYNR